MNFKKSIIFVFLAALVIMLNGCECVPTLPTQKEVTPSNYAKVMYINSLTDVDDITCYGNDFNLGEFKSLDSVIDYLKAESGLNYLRVRTTNETTLLYSPCDFIFGAYYTTCIYGYGSAARAIVYRDSVEKLSTDSAYIRLINLSFTQSDTRFTLYLNGNKVFDNSLLFLSNSGFIPISEGKVKLEIYKKSGGSLLATFENIFVKKGTATGIILKETKTTSLTPTIRFIYTNLQNI